MGVLSYGPLSSGWMSGRADPIKGHRPSGPGARAFDLSVAGNQAKLAALAQLAELRPRRECRSHTSRPPLSARIQPSPRSSSAHAHLSSSKDLIAGSEVELGADVLDRIDEIVPPGTELNPADRFVPVPIAIADKRLRRR